VGVWGLECKGYSPVRVRMSQWIKDTEPVLSLQTAQFVTRRRSLLTKCIVNPPPSPPPRKKEK